MRTVFIRHGQSTGNAGILAHDLALLELTELGWRQSREVAAGWNETPGLIVTSPYLRTQQTAAATSARFPDVPVEVWPIQEFTYLQPSRWNGTRSSERMPHIERYWAEADPDFCDGEGAESFSMLLERAKAALERLTAMPEDALVYVFSHGQFIQTVRSLVIDTELSEREKMRKFWGKGSPAISNAEQVQLSFEDGIWRHFPPASLQREFDDGRGVGQSASVIDHRAVDQGHAAPSRLSTIAPMNMPEDMEPRLDPE